MKIENRSRKRSHKLDGIGVGSIRTFPFLPILFNSVAYDPVKSRLSESEPEAEEPTNHKARNEHSDRFILPLLLATPTMQFSLDRERRSHKRNRCSTSDSVGLIFTRSYRSTLLITTPTTTPSLAKTSLKAFRDKHDQYHLTL